MNTLKPLFAALFALALLVPFGGGCSSDSPADPGGSGEPTNPDPEPDVVETPDPPVVLPSARAVSRMNIEQLARSIPIVTGGIRWEEDFGDGPVDMLQALAPTLGAPDYLLVTEENLEPSLIIAKFMGDASHRICTRWVSESRAKHESLAPEARTLVHHDDWSSLAPEDVEHTLSKLLLRFFARHVPPGDPGLEPYVGLFEDASGGALKGQEAHDGWLAVCLALMTDPEFVLY